MTRWVAILGFRRRPLSASVLVTSAIVAWIVLGTRLLDPLATSDTRLFVRDGLVRWPLAVLLLVALVILRPRWPISTVGLPRRPDRFPWATAVLTVGCLLLALPLVQFWDQGEYTAAVLFSEMATGVFEELGFRGLVFCGLVAGLGRSPGRVRIALYFSSLLFGLAHVFGGIGQVVVTALLGALFLASTLELRSLWPAAILHGLLDVGVNGPDLAPDPVAEDWAEPVLIAGDLLLFAGSLVSLVVFGLWKWWPVEAGIDPELPDPGTDG